MNEKIEKYLNEKFEKWEIRSKTGELHFVRWFLYEDRDGDLNIYIHKILKGDKDKHYHNHGWNYLSIILKGMYFEHRFDTKTLKNWTETHLKWSFLYRKAKQFHKIELKNDNHPLDTTNEPVWSIFITGKRINPDWGFYVNGNTITNPEYRVMKARGDFK